MAIYKLTGVQVISKWSVIHSDQIDVYLSGLVMNICDGEKHM